MNRYRILMHGQAYQSAADYLQALQSGAVTAGKYLQDKLQAVDIRQLSVEFLLERLLATKRPQIFAESAVYGNGQDWNAQELKLLGSIGIALSIVVYDDGRHHNPLYHAEPFTAHLLFTPGALLRNGRGQIPVDWDVVGEDGEINPERYYQLYLCRLLPLLLYANAVAGAARKQALITVPGLGCGQFAGKFMGRLGEMLQSVLLRVLNEHHAQLGNIRAVYFDPYNECENRRFEIGHLSFMVRPLTQGNQKKPQLCRPSTYQEPGDDFSKCLLFSVVAWDHVSWPGNDFYVGARATDDGVKAAATSSMAAMTGIEGRYDQATGTYNPPYPYQNWEAVVLDNDMQIEIDGRLIILPSP
ncbi:MAG: hypothetical protein ACU85E_10265 [Gammaproteobacteria bacterium]